jgi:hypothetical protein
VQKARCEHYQNSILRRQQGILRIIGVQERAVVPGFESFSGWQSGRLEPPSLACTFIAVFAASTPVSCGSLNSISLR